MRLRLIGDTFDKRYGKATCFEVVGLIFGDVDDLINCRDVILDRKSTGLQGINDLHPAFMAMQYPVFFSYGENGFHLGIKYHISLTRAKIKRGNVTAREFYSYIIHNVLVEGRH